MPFVARAAMIAGLRRARYALPGCLGGLLPAPGPGSILARSERLHARGMRSTAGYFHDEAAQPADVAAANVATIAALRGRAGDVRLSIKAPALAFDAGLVRTVAEAGATAGISLTFDAHGPRLAQPTLDLAMALLPSFPATGCALPARWRRSVADAALLRDTTMRLRIVKGEWADPDADPADAGSAYLGLIEALAGRTAPVGVATHDPVLAERALTTLLAAGTPCELEQLRGLPRRRTTAIARRLGVPVRIYLPFGPDWWPYAISKVLARPSLLLALR